MEIFLFISFLFDMRLLYKYIFIRISIILLLLFVIIINKNDRLQIKLNSNDALETSKYIIKKKKMQKTTTSYIWIYYYVSYFVIFIDHSLPFYIWHDDEIYKFIILNWCHWIISFDQDITLSKWLKCILNAPN